MNNFLQNNITHLEINLSWVSLFLRTLKNAENTDFVFSSVNQRLHLPASGAGVRLPDTVPSGTGEVQVSASQVNQIFPAT